MYSPLNNLKKNISYFYRLFFFIIFFPFKLVIFLYSIFVYKFFNIKNSKKSFLFFIYLFCITGGWINSLVTVILLKRKISFEYNENKRFSDFQRINSDLKDKGYYQQENFLTDSEFEKINNYISSLKGYFISDHLINKEQSLQLLNFNDIKGAKFTYHSNDLLNNHEIQKLLINNNILKISQEYLGSAPLIDNVSAWWSFPTEKPDSNAAQLWHFDFERPKWIKVFLYLTDCNESNGPHCFIERSHRNGAIPLSIRLKMYARIEDDYVNNFFSKDSIKVMTAKKKSILFEDTRGLHKGMRVKEGKRLILQFQYSSSIFGAITDKLKFPHSISNEFLDFKNRFPHILENFD
jgi:ectoine hydroxylase-related dioxygenase (phytanoyl-CoA dioxygenase family)